MLTQKKGYVLLETLVVIGILSIVLVGMYSSFINLYTVFRERKTYDNTEYLYKTKVLREQLTIDSDIGSSKIVTICNNKDAANKCENHAEYASVFKEMGVQYAFLAVANITTGDVNGLTNIPVTVKRYIRDLDTDAEETDVILIVAYKNSNPGYEIASINYSKTEKSKKSEFDKVTSGLDSDTDEEITKPAPEGATCTNTLAYDGTVDNNLRYVGKDPCNYVTFNGESPVPVGAWIIAEDGTGTMGTPDIYENESACQAGFQGYGSPSGWGCIQSPKALKGWRIVGKMNNVDDGSGNKETRIKLVRNEPLGNYSWDTSQPGSGQLYGHGENDWSSSVLMQELNGDYLNTSLTGYTYWYNGRNEQKNGLYDTTMGLKIEAQNMIGDAKWYLGGHDKTKSSLAADFYRSERGTNVIDNHSTEWIGKVALLYASDLAFAVGSSARVTCLATNVSHYSPYYVTNDGTCAKNDWIFNLPNNPYFLTPPTNDSHIVFMLFPNSDDPSQKVFGANQWLISSPYAVYPAVYLKSSVAITGGNGTPENPYTLS